MKFSCNILYLFLIHFFSIRVFVECNETIASPGTLKRPNKLKPHVFEPFVMPKNYDKFVIPSVGYVATQKKGIKFEEMDVKSFIENVTVTFRINDVTELDEAGEEITYSLDLYLQWTDHVIKHEAELEQGSEEEVFKLPDDDDDELRYTTLDPEFFTNFWKPDIYIESLVKVQQPEIMSPSITVRLNRLTGEMVYISRLSIRMECGMDFHYYPADIQICEVAIRSNSHSIDNLLLEWGQPIGAFLLDCNDPNFDFQLTSVGHTIHDEGYIASKTRKFSMLNLVIKARRKLSYQMVQTYLPSVFFIIITWLCFLLPSSMVEARLGISMTTLLTLTAMFSSVRDNTPIVSYVRAIDIWMLACIFFVFLTLLEFSLLVWLKNNPDEEVDSQVKVKDQNNSDENIDFKLAQRNGNLNTKRRAQMKKDLAFYIDKYAVFVFSILFIVFCVIYWIWILVGSKHFDWDINYDHNSCDDDDDDDNDSN